MRLVGACPERVAFLTLLAGGRVLEERLEVGGKPFSV